MIVWLAVSILVAMVVIAAPWRWAIGAFLFWVPFSGTAVAIIGAEPIIMPLVVCLALCMRYAVSLTDKRVREEALALVARERWLMAFLAYALISGLFFPRLFEGETQAFTNVNGRYVRMPLGPGHVSISQLGYLLIGAVCFMALRHAIYRVGPATAIFALVLQAACIGGLGFAQSLAGFAGTTIPMEWIVTNEAATLLINISEAGFARVTGVFTEASAYAGWATAAMAFTMFLFLNKIMPRSSVILTAVLGLTLLLSTSSTAYGGLGVVAVAFLVAVVLDSDSRRQERGLVLAALGAGAAIALLGAIYTAEYGPLYNLRTLLDSAIFGKQYSLSAIERGQWADTAWRAGLDTYGLGAGYGAVRSSGLGQMMFGAVGVIGCVLFVAFIAPKIALGFKRAALPEDAVASAAGIAIVPSLGVLAISGSDLGLWNMFWYYAAVAVGASDRAALMRAEFQDSAMTPWSVGRFDPGVVRDAGSLDIR